MRCLITSHSIQTCPASRLWNEPGPHLERSIRSCMGAIYDDAAGVSVKEATSMSATLFGPGLEPIHVHSAIKGPTSI